MKIIYLLFIFSVCFSCSRQIVIKNSVITESGYIVSIEKEELIFFPSKNLKRKIDLYELQKDTGYKITGFRSSNLTKLKSGGQKFNVTIPIGNKNKTTANVAYDMIVIAATLKYQLSGSDLPPKEDLGVPIEYMGKSYIYNYTMDLNKSIIEVQPFFKKDRK